jgi:hydrogenase-4 component B
VCGQAVQPSLGWTSAGFTKPLRLVLEVVLRPRRELTSVDSAGVLQEVAYSGEVPHLVEDRIYDPISRAAQSGAARIRKLQSGSLGMYVAYLIGLVVAILMIVRVGLLG